MCQRLTETLSPINHFNPIQYDKHVSVWEKNQPQMHTFEKASKPGGFFFFRRKRAVHSAFQPPPPMWIVVGDGYSPWYN